MIKYIYLHQSEYEENININETIYKYRMFSYNSANDFINYITQYCTQFDGNTQHKFYYFEYKFSLSGVIYDVKNITEEIPKYLNLL